MISRFVHHSCNVWTQKNTASIYSHCSKIIGTDQTQPEVSRKNKITFTEAVDGYMLTAGARRFSNQTIRDYSVTYRKFLLFLDSDPPIVEISVKDVEGFLASQNQISKKTLLNYHIGLSALWTWCIDEGITDEHILHKVRGPKPEKKDIAPYSHSEVDEMLSVLGRSISYTRPGKRENTHSLVAEDRN